MNKLLLTDSYKVSHHKQYEEGTEYIYSFFESRGGQFDEIVFFGLQYIMQEYLAGVYVTYEDIDEAEAYFNDHLGPGIFNRAGWEHIVKEHGGRLPIEIKAVREGAVVPNRNVMMTVVNTDPQVPWVTNYVEGLLSQLWYGCTVATQSRYMKKAIAQCMDITAGHREGLEFKLHDFGFRGVSSVETAGIGGAAHLVNFVGTDTLPALHVARKYYGAHMAGFSIPAAEHSTITSWGRDREVDAYRNMLEQFPTGLVAVVSDSYDVFNACENLWGDELRDEVIGRDGTLVVRPDSGHPPTVVVQVLDTLGAAFGVKVNEKGFKVLPDYIRVIQGDGIDPSMLDAILDHMIENGWSVENIAFGSGGGLLQKLNRDTCKFAFKCSATMINGEWVDVYKDPITDPGKKSKKGRLALVSHGGGKFETLPYEGNSWQDLLRPVFKDGDILVWTKFEEVREAAEI